jgi:alkylation response protein AidB-like acyl-CoA dehydrogenase
VAAVYEDDVVFLLVPVSAPGLQGTVQPLVAAAASATATVRFDQVFVAADRELRRQSSKAWSDSQQHGVALNGFSSVGVAQRCASSRAALTWTPRWLDFGTGCSPWHQSRSPRHERKQP